jgi:hypothetical protein
MPCHNRHLPTEIPHTFVPAVTHPDICIAMLETATDEEHGFSHQAQCGHTKKEHTKRKGRAK